MQPTLVMGIGNILLRDEGVGVRVIEAMRGADLPHRAEFVDAGTAGADLVDLIADRQKLIIVDAIEAGSPPGTVFRLTPEDLAPADGASISLHQIGLVESLAIAGHLGCRPREIVVVAIQPGEIAPGLALTGEVAAAVPKAIALVMAELSDTPQGKRSTPPTHANTKARSFL
jgi:hydrogenase maturation protease